MVGATARWFAGEENLERDTGSVSEETAGRRERYVFVCQVPGAPKSPFAEFLGPEKGAAGKSGW